MVPLVVVVINEATDASFQLPGQVVVFKQDLVFQGTVPTLDLALGLRVIRTTASMFHILVRKILRQIRCDV